MSCTVVRSLPRGLLVPILVGWVSLFTACSEPDPRVARTMRAMPPDPSLSRDWVERDLEIAFAVKDSLPPRGTADDFLRALHPSRQAEWRDQGLGVRGGLAIFAGGYSTCYVRVFAFERDLASVIVRCSSDRSAAKLRTQWLAILGPRFRFTQDGWLESIFRFPAVQRRATVALARALGPRTTVGVPAELRNAHDELTSPAAWLTYGTSCGVGTESPPAGRRHVLLLVAANRVDLLRDVLRSPSQIGRIYAAAELMETPTLEPADAAAIRAIRGIVAKVDSCDGPHVQDRTAAQLLRDPAGTRR